MVLDVAIQKTSNHLLVRHLRSRCMSLKEFDTPLAQGNSDLDAIVTQYQLVGRWKEITDHFNPPQWLVLILYFARHKASSLGANIQPQKFE